MQETQTALKNISLKPSNAERIALFVGELNGNLKLIEKSLLRISNGKTSIFARNRGILIKYLFP